MNISAFIASPIGIALEAALVYTVLDALLTALLALKTNKFEWRSFSMFLEKIGSEFVGLALIGGFAFITPEPIQAVLIAAFGSAVLAFTGAEIQGWKDKLSELEGGN